MGALPSVTRRGRSTFKADRFCEHGGGVVEVGQPGDEGRDGKVPGQGIGELEAGAPASARSPLGVIFSYRLLTPAFAAGELARWAMKPIPVGRYRPRPPRLICFFGCGEGDSPRPYQLNIHADGEKVHVDGPDISGDLGSYELARLMIDVMTTTEESHAGGDAEGRVRSGSS
jgi:hypothetical protein